MARIEKNKPLPDHTALKYEECYAKRILEWYDNSRYKDLIIQDKPDLYCESSDVGVEVTDASDHDDQEAHHLWSKLPYVNEKKKDSYLKRINQLGYECEWGALSPKPSKNCAVYDRGPASGPFMPVYSAIENKVVTLAKGQYQKCSKYELFIFRNVYLETVWLPFLLKNCRKKNLNDYFSRILICSGWMLIDLDIEKNEGNVKEITSDGQYKSAIDARTIVEKAETEKNKELGIA